MQIKANGRSAVIIAAGLLAMWVSPLWACDTSNCRGIVLAQANEAEAAPAATADTEQPASRKKSRHSRHSSRKTDKLAAKSSGTAKAEPDGNIHGAETEPTGGAPDNAKRADAKDSTKDSTKDSVWPAVANANAQMVGPAAPPQALPGMPSASAGDTLTPSDQHAMAAPVASTDADNQVVAADELNELDRAAGDKPAPKVLRPTATSVQASVGSEDTWNQTSLIGKIFIAVGGLLTLASAARMFIA
ncbi:MAG: hypothetical protein AB1586_22410 [Pseudomonadota bacterium]|jgi:hypothetical protein